MANKSIRLIYFISKGEDAALETNLAEAITIFTAIRNWFKGELDGKTFTWDGEAHIVYGSHENSYYHEDPELWARLHTDLRAAGYEPWETDTVTFINWRGGGGWAGGASGCLGCSGCAMTGDWCQTVEYEAEVRKEKIGDCGDDITRNPGPTWEHELMHALYFPEVDEVDPYPFPDGHLPDNKKEAALNGGYFNVVDVTFESVPAGATVFVDGEEKGST